MNLGSEDRAEMAVDIAAAAIFAGATGFAIWAIAPGPAVVVTAAGAGFLAAAFGLRRIKPETHSYRLPAFPLETISSACFALAMRPTLPVVIPVSRRTFSAYGTW